MRKKGGEAMKDLKQCEALHYAGSCFLINCEET